MNMKNRDRIGLVILLAVAAIFGAIFWSNARAQGAEVPAPSLDIASWFIDTSALAAVVIAVTAYARKHVLPSLDGVMVIVFSIALGAVLGVAGHFLGYLTDGLVAAALFGGAAGWLACGGVDALRTIFGGGGNAPLAEKSSTATDAARARLSR